MIKRLINKLLGKTSPAAAPAEPAPPAAPVIPLGQRVEVPADQHRIDPQLLDERAVKVVTTLQEAGFEAYIVGGAVRDLLLGLRPKDFDVATNATPEQVKERFRRAFIIGRRFRIVHVIFGRGREHEVVEVSTFRAYLDASAADQVPGNEKTSKADLAGKSHVVDASGRVLRDNVWGPQVEDAARRDFTINAMYYDPTTRIVVDYHGGIGDIRQRVLRMIGDPDTRYREDPVRIIRAVRFAAKLGFEIEPGTRKPIGRMSALLPNVPVSRMFDEVVKLLQTGHAVRSLTEIRKQGLDQGVFPVLDTVLAPSVPESHRRFVDLALQDTDRRVADGRAVAPSFTLACLLWHDVKTRWAALRGAGEHPVPALQQAVEAVFDARIGDISGRGKLAGDMREIWMMQPRFERRSGNTPTSLVEQPRYRAGYDFLRLRADAGEIDAELADWWEDYALGSDDDREALIQAVRGTSGSRRGAPPASARTASAGSSTVRDAADADAAGDGPAGECEGEGGGGGGGDGNGPAPARKRRRRRRKPAGGESGPPAGAAAPGGE